MAATASTIAIDGPTASGKTTVGQAVATALGYLFLDTGAMYRALTHLALERGIAVTDEAALVALARAVPIDILPAGPADGRAYTVLAGSDDVTWKIRAPAIDAAVSAVSAQPGVRREMVTVQQRVAERGRCVVVGRDIGTVVLPEADLKIYLTASLSERARRRADELRARGLAGDLDAETAATARRDALDSGRETSPLRRAADAITLDSTDLPVADVVARIVALARERNAR